MSGTKKKGKSPNSQKGPVSRWGHRAIRFLQNTLSRFLSWLSSLSQETNIPKALAGQILRATQRWVAKMTLAQFICLLGGLVVIITIIAIYLSIDERLEHRSITVWVSEMEDSTEPNDTFVAKNLIRNNLNVFDVENCKPVDSNQIVINITVGCYKTEKTKGILTKELRIGIPELNWNRQPEMYSIVSELPTRMIVRDIGTSILNEFPPEGTINEIQPKKDVLSEQEKSLGRKVSLNIGYLNGVRELDVFQVIPPKRESFFNRSTVKIFSTGPSRSTAYVPWEQEIGKGWSVRWINAGY